MTEQEDIRNDLDSEVFQVIGKVVTLNSLSAPTYNDWGEEVVVANSQSTVTIVPYNITDKALSQEAWGDMQPGEMEAAVRYDQALNIKDYFTIEGEEWDVVNIEKNYLPDNVVTIVRLQKQQD